MVSFDVVRAVVDFVVTLVVGANAFYQLGLRARWWKPRKP